MTNRPDRASDWRKSSYSGSGNNCVEVTTTAPGIAVRDSKNPHGPILALTPDQWQVFTDAIKAGEVSLG